MKTATKLKNKGFQPAPKIHDNDLHIFYCECLWHEYQTDEEELVELWRIKINKRVIRKAEVRQAVVAGLAYCFLETPEAAKRNINRIFFWNNKSGKYEPLGAVSDTQFLSEKSDTVDIEGDPMVAFERLKALCVEIEVSKMKE